MGAQVDTVVQVHTPVQKAADILPLRLAASSKPVRAKRPTAVNGLCSLPAAHAALVSEFGKSGVPSLVTLKRLSADGSLDQAKVQSTPNSKPKFRLEALRRMLAGDRQREAMPKAAAPRGTAPDPIAGDREGLVSEIVTAVVKQLAVSQSSNALLKAASDLEATRRALMLKYDAQVATQAQLLEDMRQQVRVAQSSQMDFARLQGALGRIEGMLSEILRGR